MQVLLERCFFETDRSVFEQKKPLPAFFRPLGIVLKQETIEDDA